LDYDLIILMNNKGFDAESIMSETPNIINDADKPLNSTNTQKKRVDINVLKARAKSIQDKENLKNSIAIIFLLIAFGAAGIFLSI